MNEAPDNAGPGPSPPGGQERPEAPGPAVPPGWYADPSKPWEERYWTGSTWVSPAMVRAPLPAPKEERKASTLEWVVPAVVSALLPLAGLVTGFVYVLIGGWRRPVGVTCIGVSMVALLVWAALVGA